MNINNNHSENLAAILIAKRNIIIKKLNDPKLNEYHVRVKIRKTAICGTQIGEWSMTRGTDHFLPHCFGHEAVGRVIEIGSKVTKLTVGDRVIISWMKNNNNKHETPNFYDVETNELINFGECCTFLKRGVFPENRVYKITDEISDNTAALLGCAFLTAYAAIKLTTENFTQFDKTIAIVGAGGIGLATAFLADSYNIKCISIDLPTVINNLFKIDTKINFVDTDNLSKYNETFDSVIICTGSKEGFKIAQDLLRKNTGKLFIVGNPPYGEKIEINIKPLLYGREIIGIGEKDLNLPTDLLCLIELAINGKLNADKLILKTFPLINIQEAFEANVIGLGGRILIDNDL